MLSVRALRSGKASFARGGRWQAMRTMLSQFASREVGGLHVTLEFEHFGKPIIRHTIATDKEGFAHFEVELDNHGLSDQPLWDVVSLCWTGDGQDQRIDGYVLAPGRKTRLAVISDIDDTIIETGITGSFRAIIRNWKRVLAEMPDERLHIPGADVFYGALGGGAALPKGGGHGEAIPAATKRPFFYVSSSPWNLFSYLVAFQQGQGLPLGPIMLRDWGFNRATLGSSSHGKHKRAAIDRILQTYPETRFALIGDDTQGDLTAYSAIVADNPGRIAAVFIRTVGEAFSAGEEAAKAVIEASGVPLWLGSDFATGQEFLRSTGLASDDDATQIVKAIEKTGEADA